MYDGTRNSLHVCVKYLPYSVKGYAVAPEAQGLRHYYPIGLSDLALAASYCTYLLSYSVR